MLDRWFLRHPRAVGETYYQHLRVAVSCGMKLLAGGLACLIHAVFPPFFTSTGSKVVSDLHQRMIVSRCRRHLGEPR